MLVASIFPVWALAFRSPWASVRLVDFFAHVLIVSAVLLATLAWVRRQGWLRPVDTPLLSWETTLFLFTRWPWIWWGVAHSWAAWLVGQQFGFKVTPKGVAEAQPLVLKAIVPYLLISAVCAITAILQSDPGSAVGYFYFCLLNAVIYLTVTIAVIALHLRRVPRAAPARAREARARAGDRDGRRRRARAGGGGDARRGRRAGAAVAADVDDDRRCVHRRAVAALGGGDAVARAPGSARWCS